MLIPFSTIAEKFSGEITGIIHGGAHHCEEKSAYNKHGVSDDNILWFEANPDLVEMNERSNPNIRIYSAALSDTTDKTVTLKITNNTEASSLLPLGTHKDRYPNIHVVKEVDVKTDRFDDLFKRHQIDPSKFNFVNLDLQGAELETLKGMGENIKYINFGYLEVSFEDLYQGCCQIEEMDSFMKENGFVRIITSDTGMGWGDALYVRKSFLDRYLNKLRQQEKYQLFLDIILDVSREHDFNSDEWKNYHEQLKYAAFMLNRQDLIKIHGEISLPGLLKMVTSWSHVYDHKPEVNGEFLLFDSIQNSLGLIFDVGARDDIYFVKKSERALVHAFEPNPKNYSKLNSNIILNKISDRITAVPIGLGKENRSIDYYEDTESIFPRSHHITSKSTPYEITIKRLDDYCEEQKIEKIDFLKIDTEGYELDVLEGCGKMMDSIDIIQFEYGGTYLDSKISLREIFDLLGRDRYYYLLQKGEGIHPVNFDDIKQYDTYDYANFVASKMSLFELVNSKIIPMI